MTKGKTPRRQPTVKELPKEPWFSRTQKIVATIISVLVLGGMLWNYADRADARYMKAVVAEEFKKADTRLAAENKYTSDRLDVKIMQDRRNELDSRIYKLESSPVRSRSRSEVRTNIFEYKQEKKELEKKIDIKQNQMTVPNQ